MATLFGLFIGSVFTFYGLCDMIWYHNVSLGVCVMEVKPLNIDAGSKHGIDPKHIDVLDGIRAISVIIVLIFHFWQQTWISPSFDTPWLEWLGISRFDYTAWARAGYLFVDMMVLISGFLLFLPVARNIIYGEPLQSFKLYYKKRAIRILPSYLLCILVCAILEICEGSFITSAGTFNYRLFFKDLLTHLTFTQTLFQDTYIATRFNVVLWTVAIEVWFYVIFPLVAMFASRWKSDKGGAASSAIMRTVALAVVFIGISHAYIYRFAMDYENLSMVINQFPAFLGCYAVGILGSLAYVAMAKYLRRSSNMSIVATALSLTFIFLIDYLVRDCASSEHAQIWQITERLKLCTVFMCFILSTALSAKWYRWIFSNRFMRYLSAISFNLYIWHQWLAVKFKYVWRIPAWTGSTPPNQLYSQAVVSAQNDSYLQWMREYALVITVASFLVATVVTYLFERPIADLLNGRPSIYNGKLKALVNKRRSKQVN